MLEAVERRDDSQSARAGHTGVSPKDVHPGEWCEGTFVYQSMSNPAATFEGEMQFVPGSLREPAGEMFAVRVAPFPLARRDDEFVF